MEKGNLFKNLRESKEIKKDLKSNPEINSIIKDHVMLREGEMIVVPCGIEHKPSAENECKVLMIEPEGTLNTGDQESEYKVDNLDWI